MVYVSRYENGKNKENTRVKKKGRESGEEARKP